MDTERRENMVRELLELDPSLKEHETDIRALIQHFEDHKPSAVVDEHFVSELRTRLLRTAQPTPSPYMQVNWWAVRLAPLGVLALLLLILVPPPISQTPPSSPAVSPEFTRESQNYDMQTESTQSNSSPEMYGFGGAREMSQDSTMSLKSTSETQSPITAGPQKAGMSVQIDSVVTMASGFVVVYTHSMDGREEIIGISPLVYPGTTDNLPIYLRTRTTVNGAYTVVFHVDNGNRIFTESEDIPAFDQYGNMLRTPLFIE